MTSMEVESDSKIEADRKMKFQATSQPTVCASSKQRANDRIGITVLPPISSLLGMTPECEDVPYISCTVSRQIEASSSVHTSKAFQSPNLVCYGPDTSFVDHDVPTDKLLVGQLEHRNCYREIPYRLPKELIPLPCAISSDAVNLLYFHHFVNYTSRLLVTHECSNNPFETVIPQSKQSVRLFMPIDSPLPAHSHQCAMA